MAGVTEVLFLHMLLNLPLHWLYLTLPSSPVFYTLLL